MEKSIIYIGREFFTKDYYFKCSQCGGYIINYERLCPHCGNRIAIQ